MKTSDFGYNLPDKLIAQSPSEQRDKCRMLVLDRHSGEVEDKHFFNIGDYLEPGDLLVANETRVLPARLLGRKRGSGVESEILLLTPLGDGQHWEALVRPGRRLRPGGDGRYVPIVDFCSGGCDGGNCKAGNLSSDASTSSAFPNSPILSAEIADWGPKDQPGMRIVRLTPTDSSMSVAQAIHAVGLTPLPPYIHGYSGDMEMYQTVYSANESSAAAPTAGLHFTRELIDDLKNRGINWATVELEVGIDTFRPVDEEDPRDHKMHTEMYSVPEGLVAKIEETKASAHRVIAVGTTSVRSLESAWDSDTCRILPCRRKPTSLFILPGYKFNVVDAMITNFHVPESTLMMLVSAFAGYEHIMDAYSHAVDEKYRFLSFGDAMFIH